MSAANPYPSLVTSEHQKPRFLAAVAALTQPFADQIAVRQQIMGAFDLDTAVGQQLDFVGQWIGVTRACYFYVPAPVQAKAAAPMSAAPLAAGPMSADGYFVASGPGTVYTSLDDNSYRLLLYAKVAENHWDGTVPGALTVMNAFWSLYGYMLFYVDNQDMTVSFILVGTPPSPLVQALFNSGELDLVPAGVGISERTFLLAYGNVNSAIQGPMSSGPMSGGVISIAANANPVVGPTLTGYLLDAVGNPFVLNVSRLGGSPSGSPYELDYDWDEMVVDHETELT